MAKVYDTATDLITFARGSSGTALRRVGYGENLVTNGDFADEATGWSTSASWNIGSGVATSSGGTGQIIQAGKLTIGKVYLITYDATTSGGYAIIFGTGIVIKAGSGITTSFTCSNASLGNLGFYGFGFTGTIDNVSVREVFFDRPTDDLVLFNHPDDIPRIEYGSDGSLKGLLIEEQRTNLVTHSEDFTQGWTELTSTVLPDAAVSPSGSTDATKFRGASGSTNTRLIHSSSLSSGTVYTYSLFAKAGEYTDLRVQRNDTNLASFTHTFDLSSGTSSGGVIELVGDGWFRCSGQITCTTSASTGPLFITGVGQTGDGTSGIYIYGAQLEAGSFATSYIPTSGSQVTRSADVASIPVSAFGYNQTAGTWVVNWTNGPDVTAGQQYLLFITGPGGNLVYSNAGSAASYAFDGSNVLAHGSWVADQEQTIAVAMSPTEVSSSLDGAAVNSSAHNGNLTADRSHTVYLGDRETGPRPVNGHIKSLSYYPRRLTDAQLQELTA